MKFSILLALFGITFVQAASIAKRSPTHAVEADCEGSCADNDYGDSGNGNHSK